VPRDELKRYVWRGNSGRDFARPVIPTGFVELDRRLPGGGWPRAALTELFSEQSGIGELSLLIPALRSVLRTEEEKWVLWIAPPFIPYAPALTSRGIDITRLLLVHPADGLKNNLWAIEQAVRSGSSAAVLAWVPAADGVVLRRWQLAAEKQCCWTVLFRPIRALAERSPAAVRIRLALEDSSLRLQILKARGGRASVVTLDRAALALEERYDPDFAARPE
jgi:cell division inhibitor SulA/protein ImuA